MISQVNYLCKEHPITWESLLLFDIFYLESQIVVHAFVSSKLDYCNALLYGLYLNVLSINCNWFKTRLLDWLPTPGNMTILLLLLYNCLSLNESGLRYISLLSTSYHLSIDKNSSPNIAHLASSDPLMLCLTDRRSYNLKIYGSR